MIRLCSLFLLFLFCGGCAQPPQTELAAARSALAQAYAAGASHLSADDYQIAARALRDSEALILKGNYDEAQQLLPFARLRAQRALILARGADNQLRQTEQERRVRALAEVRRLPAPQTTPAPPVKTTPPTTTQPPPALLSHYTVSEGETLWTIAAQPKVYNDSLLWPLLYKANRDQIRDPRQIYSGQVLSIPRELTPGDLEEARQKALNSDIFPVPPGVLLSTPTPP